MRSAFDLFLTRRKVAAVRDYLNSVTGRRDTTTSAKYLLQNEVYAGNYVFGDWRKDEAHPAIVEKEVWQAVQDVLEERVNNRVSREPISDAFTYYLRGRVFCPHCGCVFTNSVAKGGAVRYYECLNHAKRKSQCPIQRINARALHASFLREVRRAATHPTVMHRRIAESGGWQNAGASQVSLRGQLGKQKQALEMRIANYIKAIGDGRDSPALLAALDKAEAEKEAVTLQMETADQAIAQATIKRPTTGQVQESWSEVLRVWEVLTEEERADLLGSVVQVVEMTEKESVTLELLPMPHSAISYSNRFELKSQMGAGNRLSSIYSPELLAFETVSFHFKALKGGRSRTKIPRPERQTRDA